MLRYKGLTGHVQFDGARPVRRRGGLFQGEVIDLQDVVIFQSTSIEEVEEAFRDSVDDYLGFCKECGEAAVGCRS